MKRLAAVLGSLIGAVATVNGYRPLSRRGFSSMLAWWYGLIVSELPLQTIAGQAGALAAASRWLPRRVRRFAWLVTGCPGWDCLGCTASRGAPMRH